MKYFSVLLLLSLLVTCFNGCLKDSITKRYIYFRPVYSTKQVVKENMKSGAPQNIESPGKLFVKDNYIFLNELDKGVHVIDYSNPASPKNIAFIAIPGNEDIAVKGDYLFADEYSTLVTFDISNPLDVKLADTDENAFPERYFVANPEEIIVDWIRVDTTVKGTDDIWQRRDIVIWPEADYAINPLASSANSPAKAGIGGSLARFALKDERLYTVSYHSLNIFNIENIANPALVTNVSVGADIETIYPFKNELFIGSGEGMYIYNTDNPDLPYKTGEFMHAQACDPVIADDNYAYVTLRSGNMCNSATDELHVVDVTDPANATLLKTYPFTNPHGLAKDGNTLFICDGRDGLKLLNAADPLNITPVATISDMETYDVIALNNIAIVSAKNGLYLVDYTDVANAHTVGKLLINQ